LRWQRLGLQPTSRIMQTERGAVAKAERMLTLDETKGLEDCWDGAPLADMPDLVVMTLERREVGEWEQVREFDVPEPDPESEREREPRSVLVGGDIPW
jgi:hypothetical protein